VLITSYVLYGKIFALLLVILLDGFTWFLVFVGGVLSIINDFPVSSDGCLVNVYQLGFKEYAN